MSYLTLGDLWLALNDLLDRRATIFQTSGICKVYEPILQEKRKALNALPKALTAPRPLTDRLGEQDILHDSCIDTLLSATDAVLTSPRASPALKQAAQDIQDQLQLSLDDKTASYPQQAITVGQRKEKILALKDKLALITLPEGGTLFDIALDYISAGEAIDALLSERTALEAVSDQDRRQATLLRSELIGMIGRLRKSLADEVKGYATLPRTLDAQIFGYFDELYEARRAANQAQRETKEKAKAAAKEKAAQKAQLDAAQAQINAEQKAREAEEAKRRAEKAKADADAKTQTTQSPEGGGEAGETGDQGGPTGGGT